MKQCVPNNDKEEEDKQALRHDRDLVSLGMCIQKEKFRAEDRPGSPRSAMAEQCRRRSQSPIINFATSEAALVA